MAKAMTSFLRFQGSPAMGGIISRRYEPRFRAGQAGKRPPSLFHSTSLGARGSPISSHLEMTKASHQSLRKDIMAFLHFLIYLSVSDEYTFSGRSLLKIVD